MLVNVRFQEKTREKAFIEEVKIFQPKTTPATPNSSPLASSKTSLVNLNNTTKIKK